MRRIICIGLATAMCLLIVSVPKTGQAASTAQLFLSPASGSVTTGSNYVFNISVNAGGNSINSVQSVLTFSSANFSFVSITPGASFGTFPNSVSGNKITFTAGSTSPLTGTVTVATVTLKAADTGTSSVSLASVCAAGDFSPTCSAVYDVGAGAPNDLASVAGASYTVNAAPAPPAPPATGGGTSGSTGSTSSTSSSPATSSSKTPAKSSTPASAASPAAPSAGTPSAANTAAPKISGLTITKTSDTDVTVSWQSDVPTSSGVNYGISNQLGLVVQDASLKTAHSVTVGQLAKGTTYYFQAFGATAGGVSTSSSIEQLSTPGFTVSVLVRDPQRKVYKGAKVALAGQTKKTDSTGLATFSNVPSGTQSVVINGKTKLTISVGQYDPGTKTYQKQEFRLTAKRQSSSLLPLLLVVALIGGLAVAGAVPVAKRRRSGNQPSITPVKPAMRGGGNGVSPPAIPLQAAASPASPANSAKLRNLYHTVSSKLSQPVLATAKQNRVKGLDPGTIVPPTEPAPSATHATDNTTKK